MLPKQINKIITEAMGECYHEPIVRTAFNYSNGCDAVIVECEKCHQTNFIHWLSTADRVIALGAEVHNHTYKPNVDYFTPEGFFKLWRWTTAQEWWDVFISGTYYKWTHEIANIYSASRSEWEKWLISNFVPTLADFLQERNRGQGK